MAARNILTTDTRQKLPLKKLQSFYSLHKNLSTYLLTVKIINATNNVSFVKKFGDHSEIICRK